MTYLTKYLLPSLFCLGLFLTPFWVKAEQILLPQIKSEQTQKLNTLAASSIYPLQSTRAKQSPQLVVLDALAGNILVLSQELQELSRIPIAKEFSHAMDLLAYDSLWLLADPKNHQLALLNKNGSIKTRIQLSEKAQSNNHKTKNHKKKTQKLKAREPIALWQNDDYLYFSDRANHQICRLKLPSFEGLFCFSEYGEDTPQLRYPYQLASDRDGYIHVVDVLNAQIKVFNSRGDYFSYTGRFGLQAENLFRPNGLAVSDDDYVYVSDSYLGHISIFKNGRYLDKLKQKNGQPILFQSPTRLSLLNNELWVLDSYSNRLSRLSLDFVPVNTRRQDNKNNRLAFAKSSRNQMSSRKKCLSCHLSWDKGFDYAPRLSALELAQEVLPVASEKMCYSCHHGVIEDSRLALQKGHQHPDVYSAGKENESKAKQNQSTSEDEIPDNFPLNSKGKLFCTSCHSPHNADPNQEVLYEDHGNSWMRHSNIGGDLCMACHQSKIPQAKIASDSKEPITLHNHPLGIILSKPNKQSPEVDFVKEKHLQQGLPSGLQAAGGQLNKEQGLICQSCHQVHGGEGEKLLLAKQEKSQFCLSCHQSKSAEKYKNSHPINKKIKPRHKHNSIASGAVQCESCHAVHAGVEQDKLLESSLLKSGDFACKQCHLDKVAKTKKEARKLGIHLSDGKLKKPILQRARNKHIKHSSINCESCHQAHQAQQNTALLSKTRGKKSSSKVQSLCISCHQDYFAKGEIEAREKGIHPLDVKLKQPIKQNGKLIKTLTCDTCHLVHSGSQNSPLLWHGKKENTRKPLKHIEQLCIACHQDKHSKNQQEAKAKGLHPVGIKLDEPVKINKETFQELNCFSCHSVHHGQKQTASLRQTDSQGQLCANCHKQQSKILNTDHDLRETKEREKHLKKHSKNNTGLCASCHKMHAEPKGSKQPFLISVKKAPFKLAEQKPLLERDKLCLNCHQEDGMADKKAIIDFEHPIENMILRSDPKHMPLVEQELKPKRPASAEEISEFGQIACITCHDPHQWEANHGNSKKVANMTKPQNIEGDGSNSFLRHKDVQSSFCISCHGIEARLKYKFYHHKSRAR